MADKKISQLTALSAANVASATDVLAIVDTSATETKKITAKDLIDGALNGGTANGVLYLNGSKVATSGTALTFDGTTVLTTPRINITNTGIGATFSSSGGSGMRVYGSSGTNQWDVYLNGANIRFSDNTGGGVVKIDTGAVIDGNLGLGVTPSASSVKTFEITAAGNTLSGIGGGDIALMSNAYFNSGFKYAGSNLATSYRQQDGVHKWFNAPSGTAGNTISFTQAMTLDASGNLLVGTTSANGILAGAGRGYIEVNGTTDSAIGFESNGTLGGYLYNSATEFRVSNYSNNPLTFHTNNTERGRFTAGGYFKASDSGTYNNSTGQYHELKSTTAGLPSTFIQNTNANPYGAVINFTSTLDNNTNYFLNCEDNTAVRCYIWSDGDLANHDGVYGTISDERLKQDIVDASSQWDDLKAIRFRKYRMKTDVEANPDAPAMFGVVAQELAQVCPGLVDEHIDRDGEITKTVKSSILLMKAAKALQEAMARIEQLEADMAALKASA